MKKKVILFISFFTISIQLVAEDIFISKITHTFSDSLRHIKIQTDHLGFLSSLVIIEYENGNIVSETSVPGEDLVNNRIDVPIAVNKFIHIETVNFSKEWGGKIFIDYSPNIFSTDRHEIAFELVKNLDSWILLGQQAQVVKHLRLIINKKAMVPIGIKEFIINP